MDTYNEMTLNLENCEYAGACIEIGLKGTPSTAKTPQSAGQKGGSTVEVNNSSVNYNAALEEYEKLQKEKKVQDIEQAT